MPRAGLTSEKVVQQAAVMADQLGLYGFTLAGLAERLGVRQPSLYKHITSMAGLHRAISLRSKVELRDVLARATVGKSGSDAIISMAHAYRQWARLHPGRYSAVQIAPAPDDEEDAAVSFATVQTIADVLGAYRLEDDDAIDAIRAFRSALHGFVTLEASGGFQLNADIDRSFERLVSGVVVALSSWRRVSAP